MYSPFAIVPRSIHQQNLIFSPVLCTLFPCRQHESAVGWEGMCLAPDPPAARLQLLYTSTSFHASPGELLLALGFTVVGNSDSSRSYTKALAGTVPSRTEENRRGVLVSFRSGSIELVKSSTVLTLLVHENTVNWITITVTHWLIGHKVQTLLCSWLCCGASAHSSSS